MDDYEDDGTSMGDIEPSVSSNDADTDTDLGGGGGSTISNDADTDTDLGSDGRTPVGAWGDEATAAAPGWKRYREGENTVDIDPSGSYYYNGVKVWSPADTSDWGTRLANWFKNPDGSINLAKVAGTGAGIAALRSGLSGGIFSPNTVGGPQGYTGTIPTKKLVRQQVPYEADPNRRPGAGGRQYFTSSQYVAPGDVAAAQEAAATQATGLAALAKPKPVTAKTAVDESSGSQPLVKPEPDAASAVINRLAVPTATLAGRGVMAPGVSPRLGDTPEDFGYTPEALERFRKEEMIYSRGHTPVDTSGAQKPTYEGSYEPTIIGAPATGTSNKIAGAAQGGLMGLARGRYLGGATDGMADKIPANIDGQQEARLSHGEFVIPADVVSHLGNGNSDAGAQRLYDMMDKIRRARTGTPKQGKQINPDKFLPTRG